VNYAKKKYWEIAPSECSVTLSDLVVATVSLHATGVADIWKAVLGWRTKTIGRKEIGP
jgi:hypothetical protein